MAIDFTVKEANQLIDQHKALLGKLDHVTAKAAALQTSIQSCANELLTQATLKEQIITDCRQGSDGIAKTAQFDRLIHNLYKYRYAQTAIDTAKAMQRNVVPNIRHSITQLRPGLAGLSWFFGGKTAKANAAQAYQVLTDLLHNGYGQQIPQLVADLDATDPLPFDAAWQAFICDPHGMWSTLEAVCPVAHAQGYSPFHEQLSQLGRLEQKIAKCQDMTDKEQSQIKAAAEKMMAHNAMEILRSVPVEEVNRDKAGYRVKTLRDAGYNTMADIYAASNYQLASVYGISDNAAISLKQIAKQFLEEARDGVKIKLSADDQNKPATELVKTIYTYRRKNESRAALTDLTESHEATLSQAKATLDEVGNGLAWIFYTPNQRTDVRSAYREISAALAGEYAKNVVALTDILCASKSSPQAATAWDDFQKNNIAYISILEEIVPGALGNDDSLYGLPEDLAREIQEQVLFPDGLLCTLRRYQEWGVKYILHQKKVLLGDEMGLGKTVQAIATMVSLRNTGATHFMVICPASVITNWCREIPKHSKLAVTRIHGAGRAQALRSWVRTGGVAVTTFETTAYIKDDSIEKLDMITVDEAHYIKNPEARRSINVKRLCTKADRLLFMTGTALENNVEEMVALIDVLQPSIAQSVQSMTFMPNAPQFRQRVAPVYYRRKREDVLTELPELIESREWCTLNPAEKKVYEESVLSKNYAACRRLSWNVGDLKNSCKATRLLEIIQEAKAEGRKVLVFSFFLDTIRDISNLLGSQCCGIINGSVPPARRQEIIDNFSKAPDGSVLLAQIQSGGTGLNIQSASVVVMCEPQFKPSIENQAISRAYRMGQARNVLVYRLLCTNTVDERLMDVLEHKQEIFDAFADKSVAAEQNETALAEVDEKTFGMLIQEEIDRINAEKKLTPTENAPADLA